MQPLSLSCVSSSALCWSRWSRTPVRCIKGNGGTWLDAERLRLISVVFRRQANDIPRQTPPPRPMPPPLIFHTCAGDTKGLAMRHTRPIICTCLPGRARTLALPQWARWAWMAVRQNVLRQLHTLTCACKIAHNGAYHSDICKTGGGRSEQGPMSPFRLSLSQSVRQL